MAHDATFMYGITDLVGYQGGGQVGGKKKRLYPLITIPFTKTYRAKRVYNISIRECKGSSCSKKRRRLMDKRQRISQRG